ncbi:MAG TPA: bacillithiol biosynthesis cysteine-adding enzyme BshC [Vicinamibacterales bacterium]|nr:bacillithiol biosynthesis cysteine-adding enzyme BshC [Vicinamibacterales bacterium]
MSGSSESIASPIIRDTVDLPRFPWIRPLVTEYSRHFDRLAPLFAGNPADPSAWSSTIDRVARAPRDRKSLHAALQRQLDRRGAPREAQDRAALLLNPASVAIVTGQQAGVFGGPLYGILKAVTAIQLARQVERDHHVPVVPVFWVEVEDHDWDEVKSARVLDSQFAVADVELANPPGAGALPVAQLALGEDVGAAIDRLALLLAPTEFTAELLARLRERYQPGAAVGSAFAGWLEDLLGRQGLVVFEAGDPSLKPLVADLFVHELERPCQTAKLAREAGALMASLGHAPQVEPAEDSVALFYLDAAGRHGIRRKGDEYTTGERVRPAAEVRAEAAAHPERFSPNVLLRPLVQDRLFPTACYVAGPSEFAYQAQLGTIYREFGVEPPLLYSRASATVLDSAAARFLDWSRLPIEALHAQDESALNRLLETLLPPGIDRTIEDTDQLIVERLEQLKGPVTSVDPTLGGAVDTTLNRMRDTLKSLQGKVVQAAKRKDDTLRRKFTRTRALAFPDGVQQERALNVVFFLNRYGLSFGERLLSVLPLETDVHYVLTL